MFVVQNNCSLLRRRIPSAGFRDRIVPVTSNTALPGEHTGRTSGRTRFGFAIATHDRPPDGRRNLGSISRDKSEYRFVFRPVDERFRFAAKSQNTALSDRAVSLPLPRFIKRKTQNSN